MRLWPLTLLRPPRAKSRGHDSRQPILPLDENEAELLRRHRATREIDPTGKDA